LKQVLSTITSNNEVIHGVYLMWLESPEIASAAKPGQFIMVRCGEESILPRPISIHQIDEDRVALLVSVVGKGTEFISECITGEQIELFGPLGNGFTVDPASDKLLIVTGGIGIAPLYFMVEDSLKRGKHVKLMYGTANSERYEISETIDLVSATENGSAGYHGMITDLIPEYIDWADQVFACGPVAMYKAMAQMPELKDKPVQVSLEVRMGCGRGICYGCTIKTVNGLKRVCEDGPVFNLDEVIWDSVNL
jgi:dihydroorotate dehydrogenase electron transfer subunit